MAMAAFEENNEPKLNCVIVPVDRRRHKRPDNFKGNEREGNSCIITEATIDYFIKHVEYKMSQQREDIRFAHNKKFLILGSTLTVLTILTTFIIGIMDVYKPNMGNTVAASIGVSLALFLLIVSSINYSIIKYLVDLKLATIIAVRGLNCSRQSLHALLFAKIEGKLPIKLPLLESNEIDTSGTILDKSTRFWEIYGRHEKYPLNNVD